MAAHRSVNMLLTVLAGHGAAGGARGGVGGSWPGCCVASIRFLSRRLREGASGRSWAGLSSRYRQLSDVVVFVPAGGSVSTAAGSSGRLVRHDARLAGFLDSPAEALAVVA